MSYYKVNRMPFFDSFILYVQTIFLCSSKIIPVLELFNKNSMFLPIPYQTRSFHRENNNQLNYTKELIYGLDPSPPLNTGNFVSS